MTLMDDGDKQDAFIDKEIARIRALVGPTGQVIGAVSGGVDSSVAAKLMHEAIGDRYVCLSHVRESGRRR